MASASAMGSLHLVLDPVPPTSEHEHEQTDREAGDPTRTRMRHGTYYIPSGDVVFEVENTLFRVHRFFFERGSRLFRDMLSLPVPVPTDQATPALDQEGTSDNNPIKLPQVSTIEFELFLWVFYNPTYSQYDAPASTWSSILRLAHRWDFPSVRALAFRELGNTIPPATRLALGERYDAPANWRARALAELVSRADPLSRAEGEELGLEMVVKVSEMREHHHHGSGTRSRRRARGRYDEDYHYGGPRVYYNDSRSRSRSRSPQPHIVHPTGIMPAPLTPPPPLVVPPPAPHPWFTPGQELWFNQWGPPALDPVPNTHHDDGGSQRRSWTLRLLRNVLGRKKKD